MSRILPTVAETPPETPAAAIVKPGPAALPDVDYRRHAEATLERIERLCDRWLEDGTVDIDTHRTGGLLEMAFDGGGKIVVNLQPPLQELWMAARNGGFHYRWVDGAWRDGRDGSEFFNALSHHASLMSGVELNFESS
jgi:CyaY protein